jgi:phosphoglycerate dehydrogenase-like enzyme
VTAVSVRSNRRDEYERLLAGSGVDVVETAAVMLADPTRLNDVDLAGVRWIQSTWAGVDGLDWSRVPEDTVVTTLPGVFGPQIAEFVFAHLLGRTQRVAWRHTNRTWDESPPDMLRGSTLGILGAGAIGSAIAEVGGVLRMSVRGCRRSGAADLRYDEMFRFEERLQFAEGIDHLVAVLPATRETRGLIDVEMLSRLSPGASFVNVGRGVTVDTDAVVDAVRSGRLGLAVLDVTDPEPLPDDHPAWSEPNVVVTGHTAAISHPPDIARFFVENLARFTRGAELLGVVDRVRGY